MTCHYVRNSLTSQLSRKMQPFYGWSWIITSLLAEFLLGFYIKFIQFSVDPFYDPKAVRNCRCSEAFIALIIFLTESLDIRIKNIRWMYVSAVSIIYNVRSLSWLLQCHGNVFNSIYQGQISSGCHYWSDLHSILKPFDVFVALRTALDRPYTIVERWRCLIEVVRMLSIVVPPAILRPQR